MSLPLDKPDEFDALAYADVSLVIPGDSPLEIVRNAHMAFLRSQPKEMIEVMRRLDGVTAAPATGIRLALRLSLGDAALVAQEEVAAFGATPLELENAVHSAAAIGTACSLVGNMEGAQSHLLLARTLARALNLRNRYQSLTFEWGRVSGLRGDPRPEELEELLRQVMPPRRRAWGQRTVSEGYMAQGDYQNALRVLGTPDGDDPTDAAQRDFLHALMGLPPVSKVVPTEHYARLAQAIRMAARRQYNYDLSGITNDPDEAYAGILEGVALAMSHTMAQQAVRVLGRQPSDIADIAFYRLVVLLSAIAGGAILHGGAFLGRETPITEQFTALLRRMSTPEQVVNVVRRVSPGEFVLLLYSPIGDAIRGLGLTSIPLLAGEEIIHGETFPPLPLGVGTILVLEDLGLPTDSMKRWQRHRLKNKLNEAPVPLINLGYIARAYLRLAESAARMGHLNEAAAWRGSYQDVVKLLGPEVRAVIAKYPPTA